MEKRVAWHKITIDFDEGEITEETLWSQGETH
jgi:hypothetical protein